MKINTYLKLAFEKRLFGSRTWRTQIMHIVTGAKQTPFYPLVDTVGHYFLDESGERVDIEGDPTKPLLGWKTLLELEPGDLPTIEEPTKTQYGQWLVNVVAFIYPYSGAIKYHAGALTPKAVRAIYTQAIKDGIIVTRSDLKRGADGLELLINSDCEFGVKSSSSTMMDDDPVGDALRASMLKEYGDRIHDPVVQAEFDSRLIAHKKTIVAKSGAKDFYGKGGKIYSTVLMKTDGRYGSETDTNGKRTKFISKSLKEGLDMENTREWINSSISGSHSRGALTALSGVDVKELLRAIAGLLVNDSEDCGSKLGQYFYISETTLELLDGVYLVGKEKDGMVTTENNRQYLGKIVHVRAPNGCMSEDSTYCKTCMGKYTDKFGVPLGVSTLDSTLMYKQMAAAHSVAVEVAKIDLAIHCS